MASKQLLKSVCIPIRTDNPDERDLFIGENIAETLGLQVGVLSNENARKVGRRIKNSIADEDGNVLLPIDALINVGKYMASQSFFSKTVCKYGDIECVRVSDLNKHTDLVPGSELYGPIGTDTSNRGIYLYPTLYIEARSDANMSLDQMLLAGVKYNNKYYILGPTDASGFVYRGGNFSGIISSNSLTYRCQRELTSILNLPITNISSLEYSSVGIEGYGEYSEETISLTEMDWDVTDSEIEEQLLQSNESQSIFGDTYIKIYTCR